MKKYTLEGIWPGGDVSGVLKSSRTIKTVRGFLQEDPKLGWKLWEDGFVVLFIRAWEGGVEIDENLDQMELDWVSSRSKHIQEQE